MACSIETVASVVSNLRFDRGVNRMLTRKEGLA